MQEKKRNNYGSQGAYNGKQNVHTNVHMLGDRSRQEDMKELSAAHLAQIGKVRVGF